jgi:hypothetical protein
MQHAVSMPMNLSFKSTIKMTIMMMKCQQWKHEWHVPNVQ